jgi:hypothetical protein
LDYVHVSCPKEHITRNKSVFALRKNGGRHIFHCLESVNINHWSSFWNTVVFRTLEDGNVQNSVIPSFIHQSQNPSVLSNNECNNKIYSHFEILLKIVWYLWKRKNYLNENLIPNPCKQTTCKYTKTCEVGHLSVVTDHIVMKLLFWGSASCCVCFIIKAIGRTVLRNSCSRCLFRLHSTATCFGPHWKSSGGTYFKRLSSLSQWIRCICTNLILYMFK